MNINYRNRHAGFTLIELTMVLFVITLVLAGILDPLSTRMESEERNKTQTQLDDIRQSLIGYALVNGHLPCPDCDAASGNCAAVGITANDGVEDGVDAGTGVSPRAGNTFDSCATLQGNLPWATLGLSEFDAWNKHFVYRVDQDFADDTDGTGDSCAIAAGISFQICSTGNIDVQDETGSTVASDLPVLVMSYGKNVDDVTNPASNFEKENQDVAPYNTATLFIDKDYSNAGANEFDDMLMWIPTNSLIYRMVQAERLP